MSTFDSSRPALTTDRRIHRGEPDALGWRILMEAPGEPHQEVVDGEVLACLWHLTDRHLCDAESPSRIEYLDRYSDPDSPFRSHLGEIGTYRPQEILTVQVAVAMVDTVNAVDRGPVTQAPIDAVIITGDVTDNAQRNELAWYSAVINGGTITPGSGGFTSTWCGVTESSTWDERFWHPDGPPANVEPDLPSRTYGFPTVPGLIEAARMPITSPGVKYPVLSVYGNHDGLLQGTVAPTLALRALSVGAERIIGLPAGESPMTLAPAVAPHGPAFYVHDVSSPRIRVTADPNRDFVSDGEFAIEAGRTSNYWAQDVGQVRIISLDTVNPNGGWQGSIDETQLAWLAEELRTHSESYIVIASHHPSPTITNDFTPDASERRVLGSEILDLVMSFPNVIAWIAGHVHFNAALIHERGATRLLEVTTSSLIDWPQQGRIVEFVRSGGRIAIVSTVVDHDSPVDWEGSTGLDSKAMASISRTLAANDYRRRDASPMNELREGEPEVRNTVWWVDDPFGAVSLG